MKIAHINYSDSQGGAARAAYRIHRALRSHGVDSTFYVAHSAMEDYSVKRPKPTGVAGKSWRVLRPFIEKSIVSMMVTDNPVIHSLAAAPSFWPKYLNSLDVDVVHLHWLGGAMLSVEDIAKIRKPLVWTLHDMWAFCGAEHYTDGARWRTGYTKKNRSNDERGFDSNRWVWERKKKAWKKPVWIHTPSHWLGDCVKSSALMRDWPITVVPYALDIDIWQSVDKHQARQLVGLPKEVPLVLFGAVGGGRDPRKGFDLLAKALQHLKNMKIELQLVIFGQMAPAQPTDLGFPVQYMGHLHDDLSLKILYSAADVMVIPSRQDNLPNTGLESLSCGTPVAAFNTCGLSDIISHKRSGYLAKAFDSLDLARGIHWILEDSSRYKLMSDTARQEAVRRYSYDVAAERYLDIYKSVLADRDGRRA